MAELYAALSQVVASRADAARMLQCLEKFHKELKGARKEIIRDAYDSVMLPLVLIIQSCARVKKDADAEVQVPAAKSDRVVESALGCMTVLMKAELCSDPKKLEQNLYTLADILTVKKSNSSEELRLLSLKCLCTLLENCLCTFSNIEAEFSKSQPSQAVGVIVYQCISRAVEEGARGSHQLVSHAYKAIRLLVQCISAPKLWMSMLPGCGAEFSRILSIAGNLGQSNMVQYKAVEPLEALKNTYLKLPMIAGNGVGTSGASVPRSSVVVEALHALAAIVCATLNNNSVEKVKPKVEEDIASNFNSTLQKLMERPSLGVHSEETSVESRDTSQQPTHSPNPDDGWSWCQFSSDKLKELLGPTLPLLVHHPAVAVREVLGTVVVLFMSSCSMALEGLHSTLLQIVLALAHDEWDKVRAPCKDYLQNVKVALNVPRSNWKIQSSIKREIEAMIKTKSASLHTELKADYYAGFAAAKQLASAMEVAGSDHMHEWLISSPSRVMAFCRSLVKCFEFDPNLASVLLRSTAQPGPYLSDSKKEPETMGKPDLGVEGSTWKEGSKASAPQNTALDLPRMPAGLKMLDEKLYIAIRNVARLLGNLSADSSSDGQRQLVDTLLEILEEILQRQSLHWTLEAASVIVVLAEVLFGTSIQSENLGAGNDAQTSDQGDGHMDNLQDIAASLLESRFCSKLWELRTFNEDESGLTPLMSETLGGNALAQKALLEIIGVCAKVTGSSFASSGRMLRIVLMPVLERLGDPCPLVQSAAKITVQVICRHCGYGCLEDLISQNSDYVVEGMCAQLRQPTCYPRAPCLFAALLNTAKMGPKLLPLLAEPARIALKGLAIISRSSAAQYTPAFLKSLLEISNCAQEEGKALELESKEAAESMVRSSGRKHEDVEERTDDEECVRELSAQYMDDFDVKKTTLLTSCEEEALNERIRRTHAASIIASSAVELAGPLILSSDNRVSLKAMATCSSGLAALRSTSKAHEIDVQVREEYLSKEKLAVSPVPPKPDMVLPSVHIVWTPLKAALKDSRIAVKEGAMNTLIEITKAGGGDFLGRRFKDDIQPILLHEFGAHSMASKRLKVLNHEESIAPNVIIRSRTSALECVWVLAEDESTRKVFRGFVRQLVEAILPFIGKSQTPPIRESASRALLSLAKVDADVVWLYLKDIRNGLSDENIQMDNPKPGVLPSMRTILPPITNRAIDINFAKGNLLNNVSRPKTSSRDCGDRAQALLEKVGNTGIAWHELVMNKLCN